MELFGVWFGVKVLLFSDVKLDEPMELFGVWFGVKVLLFSDVALIDGNVCSVVPPGCVSPLLASGPSITVNNAFSPSFGCSADVGGDSFSIFSVGCCGISSGDTSLFCCTLLLFDGRPTLLSSVNRSPPPSTSPLDTLRGDDSLGGISLPSLLAAGIAL